MTDSDQALDAIAQAATQLVPELADRLRRYGLGEIEVSRGELRLRIAAPASGARSEPAPDPTTTAASASPPSGPVSATQDAVGVVSPAVGFFVYADGLGPGLAVGKGDPLGHVEMLGVRHDVRAPRGGTVRNLVAESGEAVEYGQVVVELEPGR
jgi:acetyl-CoA carboxylase biotin carboxyl carrier protein